MIIDPIKAAIAGKTDAETKLIIIVDGRARSHYLTQIDCVIESRMEKIADHYRNAYETALVELRNKVVELSITHHTAKFRYSKRKTICKSLINKLDQIEAKCRTHIHKFFTRGRNLRSIYLRAASFVNSDLSPTETEYTETDPLCELKLVREELILLVNEVMVDEEKDMFKD